MYFPLDYDKNKAYPLVFKVHGHGGNGGQARKADFGLLAEEREDFILVAPDGYENEVYGGTRSWNVAPGGPEATYGRCSLFGQTVWYIAYLVLLR